MLQLPLQPGKYYRARNGNMVLILHGIDGEGDIQGDIQGEEYVKDGAGNWLYEATWWYMPPTGHYCDEPERRGNSPEDLIEGPFDTIEGHIPEPIRPFVKPGPERRALILD